MINFNAISTIYINEMRRFFNTVGQSIISPVIGTSLYFIVFGSAIGSSIDQIDGIDYSAFIVPGMLMMSILTMSLSNASFGIYFERFTGSIYEILSAPISPLEIITGFIGASVTKSVIVGTIIFINATLFVDFEVKHPLIMMIFLILISITFSMFGFIIGLWADNFEKLQIIPALVILPLVFLGGSFYSIAMLPSFWQGVSYFNPVLYLISGFRWSFYEVSDISIELSLFIITLFLATCMVMIWVIFRTGWGLKN